MGIVGKKVKVVNHALAKEYFVEQHFGDIGTVSGISSEGNYIVKFSGYGEWYVPSDACEVVEDKPASQSITHNGIDFSVMVSALVKPGQQIIDSLTPEKADLWHMATGVAGEAGELLDAIKKHVVYNKELDRENVIEELGDLEFYMEKLRQNLGITREETITATIDKLSKRYANGYSDQAAQARADKNEGVVIDVEMKEVPTVFKVGDKVRMLEDSCSQLFSVGDIGTVTEIDSDGDLWANINGEYCCIGDGTAYKFELANSACTEYKIGDKVRILVGDEPFFKKGEVCTITSKDSDGDFWAYFHEQDDHWCIGKGLPENPTKFELV